MRSGAARWVGSVWVVACGCLIDNPAFKVDSGSGSVTSGADATTSAPGTTGSSGSSGASELSSTTLPTSGVSDGVTTGSTTSDDTLEVSASGETGPGATTTVEATTDGTTDGCVPKAACEEVKLTSRRYWLCEEAVPWSAAAAACEAECGMQLVVLDAKQNKALFVALQMRMTPNDKDEAAMLDPEAQAGYARASWWIGGHRVGQTFEWVDGTEMPFDGMGAWAPENPHGDPALGCAALAVYGLGMAGDGKWYDRKCDLSYRYVCEVPPP